MRLGINMKQRTLVALSKYIRVKTNKK